MKYTPKKIPEGINTSSENPLKELFILLTGIGAVIIIILFIAVLVSDYMIQFIPVELETQWFSIEKVSDVTSSSPDENGDKNLNFIAIEKYLYTIVEKLRDKNKGNYTFTVSLVENDIPNAFVVPGGNIFVTTGLLKTINSENALAMVLGHEMGHHYHRHPFRSLGRGVVIALGLLVISGAESGDIIQSLIGDVANLGGLAFSREQEREADADGVKLLVGYYGHANGASEFFEEIKLIDDKTIDVPAFLSTHPGTDERIQFLESYSVKSDELTPLPKIVIEYKKQLSDEEN